MKIMANVKVKTQQDRLKAALRENLKRRKAQARNRQNGARQAAQEDAEDQAAKGRAE